MANNIFTKFKPEETFLKSVAKYESTIDELKYIDQVNSWCTKVTNNIIKHIIDIIADSLMILINVIYIYGNWSIPFNKNSIKKLPFYNLNKQETLIDFMKEICKFIIQKMKIFKHFNLIIIKVNKDN